MTEDEARQRVELRHGRRLFVDPVRSALTWGVALPLAAVALGKVGLLPDWLWITTALVAPCMGFNLFLDDWRKNREMRDEVEGMMKAGDRQG